MKFKLLVAVIGLSLASLAWAGKSGETEGTINTVKAADERLNITHGPIEGLGMQGMTMDFGVVDPSMLNDVKPGDKVKFTVEEASGGQYVISDIQVTGQGAVASDGHAHSH